MSRIRTSCCRCWPEVVYTELAGERIRCGHCLQTNITLMAMDHKTPVSGDLVLDQMTGMQFVIEAEVRPLSVGYPLYVTNKGVLKCVSKDLCHVVKAEES